MSEPTIPPPRVEHDFYANGAECDFCGSFRFDSNPQTRFHLTHGKIILCKRCLAEFDSLSPSLRDAESQLAAIHDLLTPLLGKEPCPAKAATCKACGGTGQRNVADGLSVVECVQEAVDELKEAWAFDEQRVEWQQKAEQERDELRDQVAKLRAALARIASDEPFIVQCGGGIDVTASMQAVNRANYERIAKLIAAEVLAETTPKEPARCRPTS